MSGLIWAGIGKGIADAGSTYGNAMFKAAESELADQRAMQRAEALERLKESMLEERAQRDAAKAVDVEARALKIGEERSAKQLTTDVGKLSGIAQRVEGDSPAATDEDFRKLIEENPQYREVYRKAGLIDRGMTRNETRMQTAEDQVQAARELGASSTLLKSYQDTKKSVLDAIKEENREKRDEQRHTETMAQQQRLSDQFNAMLPIRQQQADASTTRANRPSGGGGGGDGSAKVRSTYTDDSGQRVAVMSDGSTKVLGKAADYNKSVANLIAQREKSDFQFKNLPEEEKKAWATGRLASGASAPKPSDNSNVKPGSRPPLGSFLR